MDTKGMQIDRTKPLRDARERKRREQQERADQARARRQAAYDAAGLSDETRKVIENVNRIFPSYFDTMVEWASPHSDPK